jgi:N-acetylneuraminic acid mutarotase
VPLGGIVGGVVGKVIVFAGGTDPRLNVSDQAYSSVVGDDGHLSAWKSAGSVLQPRMHGAAFTDQDTIYVMGGFRDPDVWDDVVKATVSPDGTVSPWTPAGKLPGKRSHMSVTFVDGYVYMTGGLDSSAFRNPPVLTDVERGHLVNGTLGEWTKMPDLPVELATHSSFFYGGYVYVAGGIDDVNQENGVWRAPVNADHSLGAWAKAPVLPIARGHVHHLPILGTHVYSVAGAIDFDLDSTDQIDIGTLQ